MSHRPIAALALAGGLLLPGCHATGPHADVSGTVSVEDDNTRVEVAFGERERRRIREYYGSRRGLPPGLAKKEELPPGLARQVRRDGELPPGLEGKRLPPGLERELPGYSRTTCAHEPGLDREQALQAGGACAARGTWAAAFP